MCVSWNCSSSVIEYAEKLAEETSQKLLVIQWYGSNQFSILLPRRLETMNRDDIKVHHKTEKGIF